MSEDTLNEKIKRDNEGKLFVHRWLYVMSSKTVFYNEDYYVIRNGIVYFIQPDFVEMGSKDDVFGTLVECECLGDFDINKIKREKFTYISYKKIRNKFIEKIKEPLPTIINQ